MHVVSKPMKEEKKKGGGGGIYNKQISNKRLKASISIDDTLNRAVHLSIKEGGGAHGKCCRGSWFVVLPMVPSQSVKCGMYNINLHRDNISVILCHPYQNYLKKKNQQQQTRRYLTNRHPLKNIYFPRSCAPHSSIVPTHYADVFAVAIVWSNSPANQALLFAGDSRNAYNQRNLEERAFLNLINICWH